MRLFFALNTAVVLLASSSVIAQRTPATAQNTEPPPPGTRGNADNVPFIGKSDPNGNPVRLAKATGHVSNYDEAKVPAFTLPEALVMASGERVMSAEMWRTRRRSEILKFYETEIYGRVPDNAPK